MYLLGIDIGGTTTKLGVVDAHGQLLAHASFTTPKCDPEATVRRIAEYALGLSMPIEAVGVGAPGRVNLSDGTVISSNLGWVNVPLQGLLNDALGLAAFVDNDAQAALMGEWLHGVCKGLTDVCYLTIGTGIGGAFILDGRPYRGFDNSGAEVGHIVTHAGGEPCPCGRAGCYERYASAATLLRALGGLSIEALFARCRAGDAAALATLDAYLTEVCHGLISLERLLSPQAFVIGGGISGAGDVFRSRLRQRLDALSEGVINRRPPEILLAEARNHAGIIGGAAIARYQLGRGK